VSPIYKKVPASYLYDRYLLVSNIEHTNTQNNGGKDSNFRMRKIALTKALNKQIEAVF
jgi:hypothetical protein